ncbi:uncharacterized protein B0I36DRAFT_352308 [Microdochium trichocladiopsis]|uniref:Zn(2)-C6 fungal-type domain-containing protein n=1 Tax=Microdochium trichocladiopsis TaxID=1682393 RepID=A0A9P9BMN4_9PEZI|nr:uncharacterized protein B0I36DRAFT_352308 [Microdochium trichocladiopsis]KAH7026455.1 hypothetical protein B0I36DRAFT_352308 [Microdochium trichocladiopsis]
MPPRRSHKKSRAGCKRCKSRKIKCDENHPRCGNCTKHGVPCDFEYPELASSFAAAETPRVPPSEYAGSPASSGFPPTPAMAPRTPMPLYRSPNHTTITTTSTDRMMELRLLHHWTTITCKTLAIRDPSSEYIWAEKVPNLAFSGAHFLADAVLAVSALHLRSATPHDQQLVRASHSYMAATLSEYAASLSKGITKSNAEALFLTAALIAFQSTASRVFVRDEGVIGSKDEPSRYQIPLSWFHSFQGVKAVVASSWQFLRDSGIVLTIIEAQPALNLHFGEHTSTHFGHLLEGLDKEILESGESPEDQALTAQAYQHAVAVMNWVHRIPKTAAPLVFLATVSKRFIDLLEAKRPRALAILANYFGLLKLLDRLWWLKGVSRREIIGIISLFDPDDEFWWPKLQWPLRIAVYDGDVIPTELWGLSMDTAAPSKEEERAQSGSFVSHIDLLSEMFDALQNGSGAVMDMVAHSNDVARKRTESPAGFPIASPGTESSPGADASPSMHQQQPT